MRASRTLVAANESEDAESEEAGERAADFSPHPVHGAIGPVKTVPPFFLASNARDWLYQRHSMRLVLLFVMTGCLATGCAAGKQPAEAPPSAANESAGAESPERESAVAAPSSVAPAPGPGPDPAISSEGPSATTPRLPALEVQSIGMHIGGSANDQKSKAPFVRAVERQFPAFLECFRLAGEPGRGGTFGVDLRVGTGGGAPEVEEPRTAIPGDPFRECMLRAFAGVAFEPTGKPVVISYSLRFSLGSK